MFRLVLILACASSCTLLFSPGDRGPEPGSDAAIDSGLWPGGFIARKSIGFDAATGVTGFVVAVVIVDDDLAAAAQSDGSDILFTDDGDVPLPFEIESYAGGALTAWVRLDVIGGPNTIRMYYGGDPGSAQQDVLAVWAGHRAVWHLSDDPASERYNDSVGGPQAQLTGTADQGAGVAGACLRFPDDSDVAVTDGANDKLDPGDTDSYTLSMWVLQEGEPTAGRGVVLSNRDINGTGFEFRLAPMTWSASVDGDGNDMARNLAFGQSVDLRPAWAHLALVVDRDAGEASSWEMRTYANGIQANNAGATDLGGQDNGEAFQIGGTFVGCIDEVRFVDGVLPQSYLELHHANLTLVDFLEISSEQRPMPGP